MPASFRLRSSPRVVGFRVSAEGLVSGVSTCKSLGYKTDVEMLAMDFEEFLRAKGYQDSFFEDLYGKMREARPFGYTPVDARCGSSRDDAVVRGTERAPKTPCQSNRPGRIAI